MVTLKYNLIVSLYNLTLIMGVLGEGDMYAESNMETYITICKIDSQLGICCLSQGTQTGALYQPRGVGWGERWKGESRGRRYDISMDL